MGTAFFSLSPSPFPSLSLQLCCSWTINSDRQPYSTQLRVSLYLLVSEGTRRNPRGGLDGIHPGHVLTLEMGGIRPPSPDTLTENEGVTCRNHLPAWRLVLDGTQWRREDCSLLAQGSPEHSHCTFRVQEENLLGGLPKARSDSESMWSEDGGSRMGVCNAVSSSQLNTEIWLGPGDCISNPHLNLSISELSPLLLTD